MTRLGEREATSEEIIIPELDRGRAVLRKVGQCNPIVMERIADQFLPNLWISSQAGVTASDTRLSCQVLCRTDRVIRSGAQTVLVFVRRHYLLCVSR
jgi:hypothetical protein